MNSGDCESSSDSPSSDAIFFRDANTFPSLSACVTRLVTLTPGSAIERIIRGLAREAGRTARIVALHRRCLIPQTIHPQQRQKSRGRTQRANLVRHCLPAEPVRLEEDMTDQQQVPQLRRIDVNWFSASSRMPTIVSMPISRGIGPTSSFVARFNADVAGRNSNSSGGNPPPQPVLFQINRVNPSLHLRRRHIPRRQTSHTRARR